MEPTFFLVSIAACRFFPYQIKKVYHGFKVLDYFFNHLNPGNKVNFKC